MSEKGEEVYISEAEVTEPTKELEEDEEAAAAAAAAAAASAEAAAAEVDEYFEGITELENQLGDDPPKKDGNPPEKSEYSALLDSIFGELPPKSIIKVNLRFPKPAYPNRRAKTHRGPPKCLEQNEESC